MNAVLWTIGIAIFLFGLGWLILNRMNRTMLRVETQGIAEALESETDDGRHAYRSMQYTDALLAERKNKRNSAIASMILGVGTVWLLGMILWHLI